MPTATLDPTGIGTNDQFTLGAGANKTVAVNLPDDDATTYIVRTAAGGSAEQGYVMEDLPVGAATISSHTTRARGGIEGGPSAGESLNVRLRYSGNVTSGSVQTIGTWHTWTDVNLAVPGGGSWTPTIVNATELCALYTTDGAGNEGRVTTLSWDVTYLMAPGGFVSIIAQWLGPVVGAALSMRDALSIAAALPRATRGKHRLLPGEARQLLADFLLPRPRYVFLLG